MPDMIEIKLKKRSLPDKLRYIADKSGNPTLAHLIRQCADEVEARKVLRFKPIPSSPNWYCIHDDLDEEQFLRARMCGGTWHRLEFNFEGECKAFADSLNMTAEFEEGTDEQR